MPSILIFNYQGPYAPLLVLRALPARRRLRVAMAVDGRLWRGGARWKGWLASLTLQAFPFEKRGPLVRTSIRETLEWLEDGYAVIIAPEGDPEDGGELLPFRRGVGLIGLTGRVPIVPFRIEGYWRLFDADPPFPHLAARRGRARVIVGEPLWLPPGISSTEATQLARDALIATE